jgi:hypothetical protein
MRIAVDGQCKLISPPCAQTNHYQQTRRTCDAIVLGYDLTARHIAYFIDQTVGRALETAARRGRSTGMNLFRWKLESGQKIKDATAVTLFRDNLHLLGIITTLARLISPGGSSAAKSLGLWHMRFLGLHGCRRDGDDSCLFADGTDRTKRSGNPVEQVG